MNWLRDTVASLIGWGRSTAIRDLSLVPDEAGRLPLPGLGQGGHSRDRRRFAAGEPSPRG